MTHVVIYVVGAEPSHPVQGVYGKINIVWVIYSSRSRGLSITVPLLVPKGNSWCFTGLENKIRSLWGGLGGWGLPPKPHISTYAPCGNHQMPHWRCKSGFLSFSSNVNVRNGLYFTQLWETIHPSIHLSFIQPLQYRAMVIICTLRHSKRPIIPLK